MANNENLILWKKGDPSPNPAGRPEGSKGTAAQLRKLLSAIDPEGDWTNPFAAEIIKMAFAKVDVKDKKGNIIGKEYKYPVAERLKAVKEGLDRLEGKSHQSGTMHLTGETNPLRDDKYDKLSKKDIEQLEQIQDKMDD